MLAEYADRAGPWPGIAEPSQRRIRLILAREGYLPWKLAPFLDYAAKDLTILRKVGGGYIFIHRYLLEHFAAMGEEDGASSIIPSF